MKVDLVVMAFNWPALVRAPSWRATAGTGDDVRVLATAENTPVAIAGAVHGYCVGGAFGDC